MATIEDKIEKDQLRESAQAYKAQLGKEVNKGLENVESLAKNSLIIGASLVAVYGVLRLFLGPEKRKKKSNQSENDTIDPVDSILNPIVKAGVNMAATFALSLAKDKILSYLNSLEEIEEKQNGVEPTEPDTQS